MLEHMNDHLLMKYHKFRTVELLDDARRERLKREVLRRAAQQKIAPKPLRTWLLQRAHVMIDRVRPTSKPTITLVDERGCC